jgi:hypothetical protein
MPTYTYPQGELFWMMLDIFLFAIWIWILAATFGEVFRRDGMTGGAKALGVVLPPFVILRYLIPRGEKLQRRSLVATVGS